MKQSEESITLAPNDNDEHRFETKEDTETNVDVKSANSSTTVLDELTPENQTTWKKCVSADQVPYYIETSSVPLVTSWRQPADDPEADPPEHISGTGTWRCCEDFPHCGCSRGCQIISRRRSDHVPWWAQLLNLTCGVSPVEYRPRASLPEDLYDEELHRSQLCISPEVDVSWFRCETAHAEELPMTPRSCMLSCR